MSSTASSQYGSDDEEETKTIPIEELVEQLSEKRSSTRQSSLEKLTRELQLNYLYDEVNERRLTLLEDLKRCLKKGASLEKASASKLISLVCITLGVESEDIYKELAPSLNEIIANTGNTMARSEALKSTAILTFVANEDELATISLMQIFSDIFSSTKYSDEEIAVATRFWALLATSVSRHYVFGTHVPALLGILIQLLKSDSLSVRISAGETIALLFEIGNEEDEDFDPEDFAQFGDVTFDYLINTLTELASDKGKHRGKKEKAKQKVPFKDILASIEYDEPPRESLSILHQKFEFSSWEEHIQLNALRDVLGHGFQIHFERNDLLQEIFNVKLDREAKKLQLSAVEKRLLISPSSIVAKSRTKELKKQRHHAVSETDLLFNG